MDEAFILQTVGRLYLENQHLHTILKGIGDKDKIIAELQRRLELANVSSTEKSTNS